MKSTAKKLVVTTGTKVSLITELLPGDVITHNGMTGVITDVRGSITDGLLNYYFTLERDRKIKFTFKLIKA